VSENIGRALTELGIDSADWNFREPGAEGWFAKGALQLQDCTLPDLNEPVWTRRHTNRSAYSQTPLAEPILKALNLEETSGLSTVCMTGKAIHEIATWVKRASEVRFQTEEVNAWFAESLRYGKHEANEDGLHVDTLGLPPGGGALLRLISDWKRLSFLNRLGAYKLFSKIEAENFVKTPLVLAILGEHGTSAFEAGRHLQKTWLKLTELGLSAQPYYVVTDLLQRRLLGRVPEHCVGTADWVGSRVHNVFGADHTLHCLLRVGVPLRSMPVSGRLSLRQLLCRQNESPFE
jgi:hypothetical protein